MPKQSSRVRKDDLCARIDALCYDMTQLQLCVQQIAEINAIENVLCRGFAEMREGLDLLRQASSGRIGLGDEESLRLGNLRTQMKAPSWADATTLPISDQPVKFIGEVVIVPPDSGPGSPFSSGFAQPESAQPEFSPNRDQYGSAQS